MTPQHLVVFVKNPIPGQVKTRIGSDCLDLTTDELEQAFTALETVDVVVGPATDGGYYLLGMNQLQPALFADDMPRRQPTLRERTEAVVINRVYGSPCWTN